jgi:hypothetical protein
MKDDDINKTMESMAKYFGLQKVKSGNGFLWQEKPARKKRRPTKRVVDEGESAPLQAESTPEHLPIEEADTTPALRN